MRNIRLIVETIITSHTVIALAWRAMPIIPCHGDITFQIEGLVMDHF